MRKGLFAIVLVAASFGGGAVVNGPGLRWVRDLIQNHPGIVIGTTTLGGSPAGSEPDADPDDAPEPIPAAPLPPLVVAPEPGSAEQPRPKAPEPPRSQAQATRDEVPEPLDPRGLEPVVAPEAMASMTPAAIEPPVAPPIAQGQDGTPAQRPIAAAAGSVDPQVALASLAREPQDPVAPPAPAPPAPAPTDSASSPTPSGHAPDDWGAIRREMRALGVSRFGVEGEPDGRVRFHCVIPLAGQRAVGQQFEAEGDDALAAARTALRRVALWRATERPSP